MKHLHATAQKVCQLAQGEGIPIAIVGAVALNVHGVRRSTFDVDALAAAPLTGVESSPLALPGGGQQLVLDQVPVDILFCGGPYQDLYEAALEDAAFDEAHGYIVVSLPYLVLLKMVAGRVQDQEDVDAILQILTPEQTAETQRLAEKYLPFNLVEELNSAIGMAEVLNRRRLKRKLAP